MQLSKCSKEKIRSMLFAGRFGIEKESLRVNEEGRLATTSHPKLDEKHISMDFSESQVEFISDVHSSVHRAGAQICILEDMVEDEIYGRESGREYVWTYSNPPEFFEEEIKVAYFSEEMPGKTSYRKYLSQKYGKAKMLYSGVHLNFSLPVEFFETLYPDTTTCLCQKNEWYLTLADRMMSEDWLIVALTAASPVAGESLKGSLQIPEEEAENIASFRNSHYGYWNFFVPELSYENYDDYLASIQHYIDDNEIESIQELYYPVRLKPPGENTLYNLKAKGVSHIELRMLDLNPMVCSGVEKRDLLFCHMLMVYRLWEMVEEKDTTRKFQSDGDRIRFHKKAALQDFWESHPEELAYALDLLDKMELFFQEYEKDWKDEIPADYDAKEVIRFQRNKLLHPKYRYAALLKERYGKNYMESRMKDTRNER